MIESLASPHPEYRLLNLLTVPAWVAASRGNALVFANTAAKKLSAASDVFALRHGSYSAHAEEQLAAYLPALRSHESIIEIWTLQRNGEDVPLSCRLSLIDPHSPQELILVEGIESSLPPPTVALPCDLTEHGLYGQLFHTNGAPMLLIDPTADGLIVDANLAACRFYGYTRKNFCRMHTWEINALGRQVLPIMSEVAKLPGGHRPLNFVHRLADGSLRDVQTYASPLEMEGKRLMLCVVHDVTEQKRLKNELEYAASRDPLTSLWNRRHFQDLLEKAHEQKRRQDVDFSLLMLDIDRFKNINDRFGHGKGDEVLVVLAQTLTNRVRESDTVCRWGGEEFIILLPQTDISKATHLADCLRICVTKMQIPEISQVTVSIGAVQHQFEDTKENLLKRADVALYQAKTSGRNKVVVG